MMRMEVGRLLMLRAIVSLMLYEVNILGYVGHSAWLCSRLTAEALSYSGKASHPEVPPSCRPGVVTATLPRPAT